ncbi:hypothetical protein P3102_17235 [Amycolatopsis sp. QT-25]|uniref:hypothetical protein n=1 Tax=Amycolatopsis sp. QT-25 TaxID=3034022 RepID=UPI0023EC1D4C|nr:hypothetical protein [Amycolatopsis sp. QT-25]WET82821.1 hypothetical protein P3102_17235 [Amycolatopsis sp. QT-25]
MSEKARKSGVLSLVFSIVLPFLVFIGIVGALLGSSIGELSTGEDVTVTEISGCTAEGSAVNGRPPYCSGKWRFADGRPGSGRILGEEIAAGDTVFAGDGFAYRTRSPLIWKISAGGALGLFLAGMVMVGGVMYRLDVGKRRCED